jgi:putative membrane protein insertion efficiency factor
MAKTSWNMKTLVCLPIKAYQWFISPWMSPSCRFLPSCSHYALDAIQHYGMSKGLWYALRRVLRCHPWANGGYDPVLPNEEKKQ